MYLFNCLVFKCRFSGDNFKLEGKINCLNEYKRTFYYNVQTGLMNQVLQLTSVEICNAWHLGPNTDFLIINIVYSVAALILVDCCSI